MKICPKSVPKGIVFILLAIFSFSLNGFAQDDFLPFGDTAVVSGQPSQDGLSGEFETFEETSDGNLAKTCDGESGSCTEKQNENLFWILGIIGFTVLAGFFVRFRTVRNLRGIFLVVSLVVLGFYRGACPCPISGLQNVVLAGLGVEVPLVSLIWFLALLPVTYFFGRVYCGWICHLGALQEFIYLPSKIKILQTEKAQKRLRAVRIFFLAVLILQLIITRTNIFKHYDPFKAAFNLMSSNLLSWILLGLLLVSSVFIYRPFCKTVCPVGLILGWVNKLPGASVLGNNGECSGCKTCEMQCKIRAITRDDKFSQLDNQECIACGECVANCHKNAIGFFRNDKKRHHDQIVCKRLDI